MKSILIATALAGASLTPSAYAQSLAFKGIPLGSPKEALQAKFPSIKCSKPMRSAAALGEEYCTSDVWQAAKDGPGNPLYSYAGQPATDASFGIVRGAVESFTMQIRPESYEAIRGALREVYGQGKDDRRTLQTVHGAAFSSRTWTARVATGSITLLEHEGSTESGVVSGRTAAYDAYQQGIRSGDPKAGAKDL